MVSTLLLVLGESHWLPMNFLKNFGRRDLDRGCCSRSSGRHISTITHVLTCHFIRMLRINIICLRHATPDVLWDRNDEKEARTGA
jgi:hypothetical protein